MSTTYHKHFESKECKTTTENSKTSSIQQAKLEEYRTLRQEILDLEKIQHEITLFIFTGVSAIYALAFNSNELYLLFICYMILVPLRCRHIFYHEMVTKIATYICVAIEKDIRGLNWESKTHTGKADDSKGENEFQPIRIHYYMYSIVAWCTAVLIAQHTVTDCSISIYIKLGIIISTIFLSCVVSRYDWLLLHESANVRVYYKNAWENIFNSTSNTSENSSDVSSQNLS